MATCCSTWVLMTFYIVSLIISAGGIWTLFTFPTPAKPDPIEVNVTSTPKTYFDYDRGYDDGNKLDSENREKLKEYEEATTRYSDYNRDPRWTLGVPCAMNILLLLPPVLIGLCSKKIFSTTIGLYSCVVLWGINLSGFILLQNMIASYNMVKDFNNQYLILVALQISMLIIITIQVVLAAWELRRQKTQWPVFNISNIFTLNAVFLTTRITVGIIMMDSFIKRSMWRGVNDPKYEELLGYSWDNPKIKFPEYLVYPVLIALTYCVAVSIENVLSHLLGYLHKNMMSFTTSLCTIFYGGVAFVTSPIYIGLFFSVSPTPRTMNYAIGLLCLYLVHAILSIFKPSLVNGYLPLDALLSNSKWHSSLPYSADEIRTRAATLRDKFKGSNTLLYNTTVAVLSSLSLILEICHEVWWWAGTVMVCGNVVIVSRAIPALILETALQKVEDTHILKESIHVVIESVLLLTGVVGSFRCFYNEMAVAIIINILLIILQVYRLFRHKSLQATIRSLNTEPSSQPENRLLADNAESGMEEQSSSIY